ncbi:MAG: sigma-70 family RNA polymerase sigma factor [Actinomycetota bacterium]|nr:sigma-70 family RNA polymerase sigma factor [Actinomycetota bacterium]
MTVNSLDRAEPGFPGSGSTTSRHAPGGRVAAGDAELLQAVSSGDESALEAIYVRYSPAVYESAKRKLCNPTLAEDVVQQVFVALWRHPQRFNARRGSLRAYLLMLAHSHSVDLIRSESARRHREARDATSWAHDADDPETVLLRAQELDALRYAYEVLSEREWEAIELAFFGGYTYREVALILEEPEGTVKSRIRLGLSSLRSALSR